MPRRVSQCTLTACLCSSSVMLIKHHFPWETSPKNPLYNCNVLHWPPTPVFLPGDSHGQRSLAGYTVHGIAVGPKWLSTHTIFFTLPIMLFCLIFFYSTYHIMKFHFIDYVNIYYLHNNMIFGGGARRDYCVCLFTASSLVSKTVTAT